VVPTFTMYRSTGWAPSYVPAASPRVRRRLSSWPPHRRTKPASESPVADPCIERALLPGPYPPDLSRSPPLGGSTTGSLALRLPSLLAEPGSSGSTAPSRLCQGRLPPSPALPGSGCPQLHRPAATGRKWVLSSHWVHGASWRTRARSDSRRSPTVPTRLMAHSHLQVVFGDHTRQPPRAFHWS